MTSKGWSKKLAHFVLYALTTSNIDRFSNLFLCRNKCENRITFDEVKAYKKCASFWATLYIYDFEV